MRWKGNLLSHLARCGASGKDDLKGVIVRAMASYKLPEWVRISVGTMPQNVRCIEVLKEVLGK